MDTDGVNFRHQKQKEKAKKFSYEEAKRRRKQSSIPRRHRSIRQMMEKLLERRNPA